MTCCRHRAFRPKDKSIRITFSKKLDIELTYPPTAGVPSKVGYEGVVEGANA
jgi:hypothetical protein